MFFQTPQCFYEIVTGLSTQVVSIPMHQTALRKHRLGSNENCRKEEKCSLSKEEYNYRNLVYIYTYI